LIYRYVSNRVIHGLNTVDCVVTVGLRGRKFIIVEDELFVIELQVRNGTVYYFSHNAASEVLVGSTGALSDAGVVVEQKVWFA